MLLRGRAGASSQMRLPLEETAAVEACRDRCARRELQAAVPKRRVVEIFWGALRARPRHAAGAAQSKITSGLVGSAR